MAWKLFGPQTVLLRELTMTTSGGLLGAVLRGNKWKFVVWPLGWEETFFFSPGPVEEEEGPSVIAVPL